GYLTHEQLHKLMESANLGISDCELQLLMGDVEKNSDGVIDYSGFFPLILNVAHVFQAKRHAQMEHDAIQLQQDHEVIRT
ncbi:unnamed protein product, partial [Choristocarpus tenellus]